ncbi:MAG: ATP-dependent DNA helicase RecG [Propionibacteriaceae bacterium]|jgi:ATP-dependent DNA helicase RecG|nr:ATP-dependent DNA helicase RecG [Propionibacteriaceae bacterium]
MSAQWASETFRTLHAPLTQVLGDKTAKALSTLGLNTVDDLLHHAPRRYLSGTETTDLAGLHVGTDAAIVARVVSVERRRSARASRLEAILTDGTSRLAATWFSPREHLLDWWQKQLSLGVKGIFVGRVGMFNNALQMTHPDFVMLDESAEVVGRATEEKAAMARQVQRNGLVGIYPASAKVPTWRVGECAEIVLDSLGAFEDPLSAEVRQQAGVMGLYEALCEVHRPTDLARIEAATKRLKFDEAFALQLVLAYRRRDAQVNTAPVIEPRSGGILDAFDAALPFALTDGQLEVSQTIQEAIASPHPMQRLLQGEVGSGKTVVALRAMLAAVDAGYQAALLAPTEVLAAQHYATIRAFLGSAADGNTLDAPAYATDVVLLSGSSSAVARRNALNHIASGQAGIVIGTHALLQASVEFANLALVVVDEQHRFGVEQRSVLTAKGREHPHALVMTATPIPRSVAMTVFGDLEVSTLAQVPSGRADVSTTVVNSRTHPAWVKRVWERVSEEVAAGRQAFVVAPRIGASDSDTLPGDDPLAQPSATVESLIIELADALPGLKIGSLHGRMSAAEKTDTMELFARGALDVLVATTVIEVGVDVPNASVMVVMDADRFGVSQLHQLRGRIGRGANEGVCLLVTNTDPASPAAARLAAVASTRDGFALAELDLAQRREGDVLGSSQSGRHSALRLLSVISDADLIEQARGVALACVEADPQRHNAFNADIVASLENNDASEWLERT